MLIQLNPPIPLETSLGAGLAHFLIDYSCEHDLFWVVFLNDTGECWTFNNKEIRAQKNITLGRKGANFVQEPKILKPSPVPTTPLNRL